MIQPEQIQAAVFAAIDRVNEVSLDQNSVAKNAATVLTGDAAQLDSMGFVNFIVALEELLAGHGLNVSIVEEINARGDAVPRTLTVAALVEFLTTLAKDKAQA